jgi:signal transduction histidine kinase
VRTPLNHIINHLEVALDNTLDRTTRGHLESSLTASKSLIYVINDLLDLTKLENSDMLVHEEPFSVRGVMLEVVGVFVVEAERKGLRISFNIDNALVSEIIMGDPGRLRQALSNILSNSIENSSHGTISVNIRPLQIRQRSQ